MKILYIGTQQDDAEVVASALHGLAEDVVLSWTSDADDAMNWIDENRDLTVLVVEAGCASWPAVLKHARGLTARPPIVVIAPEGTLRSLPAALGHPLAALEGALETARSARAELEEKLARAVTDLQDAEQRHWSDMASLTEQIADRQTQYDMAMARSDARWAMVDEQLREAAIEVARSRRDSAAAAAEVDRLSRRDAELSSRTAEAVTAQQNLERRLTDAARALDDANARAADERRAASERLAERERDLQAELTQETDKRRTSEDSLAAAIAARETAEKQHASAIAELTSRAAEAATAREDLERKLTDAAKALDEANARAAEERRAASEQLAERERALNAEINQETDKRRTAEDSLAAAIAARETAEEQHASAIAELTTALGEVTSSQKNLERQLASTEAAFHDADERATRERLAASKKAAEREAELDGQLGHERATRTTLEQKIAAVEAMLLEAEQRHDAAMSKSADELTERQAQFDRQLSDMRLERDSLQQSVATTEEHSRRLDLELCDMRERLEQARTSANGEIRRLTGECLESRRELEKARSDFQETLDRLSSGHAATLAALTDSIAEREDQLQQQTARHEFALRAAEHARLELQADFATTLAARTADIEDLRRQLTAVTGEHEATRRQLEHTQAEAARLRKQLDENRVESRRLFQQAAFPMFRCARDGALREANSACMALVGGREIDELVGANFAAAVFETPKDLYWLAERCMSTRATESIETTWRRADGGRMIVRLTANAVASDLVEIACEDLTRVRVLQDRLDQAHRMEAVGRLASEVAVTCGNLLSDVHQHAQQWLIASGSSASSRNEGEMLLEEVTRAAGLLRQLAAYGDEQKRTSTLVDLNTLMRDLEPVLKRVAGDGVEIQLPDTSSSLKVDAGTERVERLLVNLAAYGRQRMPFGGQLRIELGTIEVDREFTARYPNVRLGSHALITVTENRRHEKPDGLLPPRDAATTSPVGRPAQRPGVELRTLQGLVGECGGHLWMKVQPLGDMVAKIRLPLLSSGETHPPTPSGRTAPGRGLARWFQH